MVNTSKNHLQDKVRLGYETTVFEEMLNTVSQTCAQNSNHDFQGKFQFLEINSFLTTMSESHGWLLYAGF